jgi:hypothetical protein
MSLLKLMGNVPMTVFSHLSTVAEMLLEVPNWGAFCALTPTHSIITNAMQTVFVKNFTITNNF